MRGKYNMKAFRIVLTKSYIITIKAENEQEAKGNSELFTCDIQDISTEEDRKEFNFEIEDIECTINEAFDVLDVDEENI